MAPSLERYTLWQGDCLARLRELPDASVDACVTDPPYGLSQHTPEAVLACLTAWVKGEPYRPKGGGFMGRTWDAWVPGPEVWREVLRVLKPGGHLLAAAGTRSMDLMGMAVRLAGFELRDGIGYAHDDPGGGAPLLAWAYGSGFPHSMDVSKAIDERDQAEEMRARRLAFTAWVRSHGITAAQINKATGTYMGTHYLTDKAQPCVMTLEHLELCRHLFRGPIPAWVRRECALRSEESVNLASREITGGRLGPDARVASLGFSGVHSPDYDGALRQILKTDPLSEEAATWAGWGTALKPAWEPWLLARKPLIGTVAENVLTHGTGALNIDGCRLGERERTDYGLANSTRSRGSTYGEPSASADFDASQGRWPANVIHDGSPEVLARFPSTKTGGGQRNGAAKAGVFGDYNGGDKPRSFAANSGSAARFYYCAKASPSDRGEGNTHPTVKPTALMAYLCRLITPPGGLILDPFAGSGSTGRGALREGFRFLGIEADPAYYAIAHRRLAEQALGPGGPAPDEDPLG